MPKKKYKIRKGAVVQKVPEGIIIFDVEESKLYTFNETAAVIFQGLKKDRTIEQIADALTSEYDITSEKAKKEIMKCIRSLETLHIVESS